MTSEPCYICGDKENHHGAPHGEVTGDGKTRAHVDVARVLRSLPATEYFETQKETEEAVDNIASLINAFDTPVSRAMRAIVYELGWEEGGLCTGKYADVAEAQAEIARLKRELKLADRGAALTKRLLYRRIGHLQERCERTEAEIASLHEARGSMAEVDQEERRKEYAEAINEADTWVNDGGLHRAEAAIAKADEEIRKNGLRIAFDGARKLGELARENSGLHTEIEHMRDLLASEKNRADNAIDREEAAEEAAEELEKEKSVGWTEGHKHTDSTGVEWLHPGKRENCNLPDCKDDIAYEHKELEKDYDGACKTIAAMHEAAVGSKRGPIKGVVEDVAELRKAYLAARLDRDRWQKGHEKAEKQLEALRRENKRLKAEMEGK